MASKDHFHNKLVILMAIIIFMLCSVCAKAELPRLQHPVKGDEYLSFLVIGDWGRKGYFNQSAVAHQMGIVGEELNIDYVISTGDNFYDNGLTGVNDPAFEDSFTNIYTAPSLQKQWYNVLGNHDYRGDVLAQLSPALTRKDNRWLCMRSFILSSGIAEFFFLDTNPFVEKYFTEPKEHVYDWRGVLPRETYVQNLLNDVDLALRQSTAKWKIVVGHHTIKSAGHHGNTEEVNELLLPILEAYEVDLYINGHDHCLEHMTSDNSPIQFLTSGGGSKAWRGDVNWENPNDIKFFYDGQGFMSAVVEVDKIDIAFYDIFGEALHKWEVTKSYNSDF